MREIKFRAWDIKRNEMVKVCSVVFDINNAEQIQRICCLSDRRWLYSGEFIIMQYTGLKDKNGVEIYEGDICEYWTAKGDRSFAEIKFIDGCFEIHSVMPFFTSPNPKRDYLKCLTCNHAVEVIGNIYENHELLEVKNLGGEV